MYHEFSKREKKIARALIDKGIQKEIANGLKGAEQVLNDWKTDKLNNLDAYHTLYKYMRDFDKEIARRYDRILGSHYYSIIIGQLAEGTLCEEDLVELSEQTRIQILGTLKVFLSAKESSNRKN
jgi:hypothetical protein